MNSTRTTMLLSS
ncbi:hypothetical protein LINPERPRIM_LOCUS39183 [Linum perenne]